MAKVITQKHPFMKKVNTLYCEMEKLGIMIVYGGNGGLNIVDTENDIQYKLKDSDTSQHESFFPTGVEFKLVIED